MTLERSDEDEQEHGESKTTKAKSIFVSFVPSCPSRANRNNVQHDGGAPVSLAIPATVVDTRLRCSAIRLRPVSLTFASWNRIAEWLRHLAALQGAA